MSMDPEVRTAQLIMKGTLMEMGLAEQIMIEEALQALREVGMVHADVIEFAASLYCMELAQMVTEPPAEEGPTGRSIHIHA